MAVEADAVAFAVVGEDFFCGGVFDTFVAAGADTLLAHAVVGIQEDQVVAGKVVKAARNTNLPPHQHKLYLPLPRLRLIYHIHTIASAGF